ncbi:MAG: helix-turn-helix domain-containing protein [Sarcina sp.]
MSNQESCKGKHLQMEDRLIIEYGLDQNYTLKELAEKIQKDPTTVSKEIKRSRFFKLSKTKVNILESCEHHKCCTKTNLCNNSCNKKY